MWSRRWRADTTLAAPARKPSARNQFVGKVAHVTPGAVNAEVVIAVVIEVGGGPHALTIAAIVTQESVKALGLAAGVEAAAIFKASSVIVGVPG